MGSSNPSEGSTIEQKLPSSHFPYGRFTIGRTAPRNHYINFRQQQRRLDTNTVNVMQLRSVSEPVTTTYFSPLETPSLASVTSPSSTYAKRMVLNKHLKLTWGQKRVNEHRGHTSMSRGHVERERIPILGAHFGHLLVCEVYAANCKPTGIKQHADSRQHIQPLYTSGTPIGKKHLTQRGLAQVKIAGLRFRPRRLGRERFQLWGVQG